MRLLIIISLCLSSVISFAQNVSYVEYYFDADPGFGNGTSISITAAPDFTRDFTIPLNATSEGFHILYIRAKSNGHWSIPFSKPVFVQQNALTTSVAFIDQLEYYFDSDPGFGNGIQVPITSAVNLTQNLVVPLTAISEGFHMMYYRARDVNGYWSIPIAKPVFVQYAAQTTTASALKRIEFFIDVDPGPGNGIQVPVSGITYDQLTVVDLSAVSTGFHLLFIRSQDQNGRWSIPYSKPIFVQSSGSNIVSIEYYFNDGITQTPIRIYNSFTPGKDLTIDFSAVLDGLSPNTTYTIHIVAINSDGKRSTEVTHTFTTPAVICDPLPPPTTIGATRCENGSVILTAAGATGSQAYHWYESSTDLIPIAGVSGNSFTTPDLTNNTTYFVSIVNGTCESSRTEATATILSCNLPPEILSTEITAAVETVTEFDLSPLLSDPDDNLDQTSLTISTPPVQAIASLNGTILSIDYSSSSFIGTETLQIEVCDLLASCTQQTLSVKVVGELEIFNALSPNNDLKNEFFYIRYIDLLPYTKQNVVSIFNRWGALVFRISNYNNQDRVFNGSSNSGNDLPSGTYFYKIEFQTRPEISGYLTIKK